MSVWSWSNQSTRWWMQQYPIQCCVSTGYWVLGKHRATKSQSVRPSMKNERKKEATNFNGIDLTKVVPHLSPRSVGNT
eukprot:scaffold1861_cov214-Chaetoceros_neogracile.AAC.2